MNSTPPFACIERPSGDDRGGGERRPERFRDAVRDDSGVNDWTCAACGENNFARRVACFRCGAGKEEGAGVGEFNARTPRTASGAFYTLVPIRRRSRGERRSLRTFPGVSLRPPLAFNPRPRRLSTPTDAYELHPAIRLYRTALRRRRRVHAAERPRRGATTARHRARRRPGRTRAFRASRPPTDRRRRRGVVRSVHAVRRRRVEFSLAVRRERSPCDLVGASIVVS
jgi:hypothetical protein